MEFVEWLRDKYDYTGTEDSLSDVYSVYELHWLINIFNKRG